MRDFIYHVTIPPQAIDMHGHMNNVYYFTLMQEAAFAHSAAVGDTVEAQYKRGEIWLIRKNEAKYIKSAKLMDEIEIHTYTQTEGKATSCRYFEFKKDGELIATAKTEFVYIDLKTNRPKAIPAEIITLYS